MRRALVATTVVVVVIAAVIVAGAIWWFRDGAVPFVSDTCRLYGKAHTARLSPEQSANAAIIANTGMRDNIPRRGIVIALATAMQESKLANLPAGDRDSIGLFQQRPSQGWGDPSELRDPRFASRAFYHHLVKISDWQHKPLTEVAQQVQRSGHPGAYARWEADAKASEQALSGGRVDAVSCDLRKGSSSVSKDRVLSSLRTDASDVVSSASLNSRGQLTVVTKASSPTSADRRVAYWLVAQSRAGGITKVTITGDRQWSKSGTWSEADKAKGRKVVADFG